MMDEFYEDDYMDDAHIPRIEVKNLQTIQDIELELATNYDEFYRRIITFIIESIENTLPENEPLNEYISRQRLLDVPKEVSSSLLGYKSLNTFILVGFS